MLQEGTNQGRYFQLKPVIIFYKTKIHYSLLCGSG